MCRQDSSGSKYAVDTVIEKFCPSNGSIEDGLDASSGELSGAFRNRKWGLDLSTCVAGFAVVPVMSFVFGPGFSRRVFFNVQAVFALALVSVVVAKGEYAAQSNVRCELLGV